MGAFSNEMRKVAKDLCTELGNKSTLTLVTTVSGDYDPLTGVTPPNVPNQDFIVYTAQSSHFAEMFPNDGQNTNLEGFYSSGQLVPWFGRPIDSTWLFDGHNITEVSDIKSQGDIIAYNIIVGEKVK